jgi:hypothetical protein
MVVVVGDVVGRRYILIIYIRIPNYGVFNMMANNRELLENGSRISDIRPGRHLQNRHFTILDRIWGHESAKDGKSCLDNDPGCLKCLSSSVTIRDGGDVSDGTYNQPLIEFNGA